MDSISDIARATIARHRMLSDGDVVLAMVSGGADSVALLRLLASGDVADVRLSVLHVDHMLRGADSRADAAFVESLCRELEVDCRVVRFDVGAFAEEHGLNLEDAGRRVRYRFAAEELDAGCEAAGVGPASGRIATAHTEDDLAETFLMRVVTGAGRRGLAGVPPVRGRVVRPLIEASRSDVVSYLDALGQAWREDATNADVSRLRARVRHELKPLAETINPAFTEAAARTSALLRDEDAFLDDLAAARLEEIRGPDEDVLALDAQALLATDRVLARRVLRAAVVETCPDASRIEAFHVDAVLDGVAAGDLARDLPGGVHARLEYDRMVLSRPEGEGRLTPALLEVPGSVDLGPAGAMSAKFGDGAPVDRGPCVATVDAELLSGPLTIDSAHEGDRMRPLGMEGTKKLSDLFIDAKVPRRQRRLTPVVRDADRIVWVAGVRLAEEYRVTDETTRALVLTWQGC